MRGPLNISMKQCRLILEISIWGSSKWGQQKYTLFASRLPSIMLTSNYVKLYFSIAPVCSAPIQLPLTYLPKTTARTAQNICISNMFQPDQSHIINNVCIYIYIYMYVSLSLYIYIYIYINTNTYIYIYIYQSNTTDYTNRFGLVSRGPPRYLDVFQVI